MPTYCPAFRGPLGAQVSGAAGFIIRIFYPANLKVKPPWAGKEIDTGHKEVGCLRALTVVPSQSQLLLAESGVWGERVPEGLQSPIESLCREISVFPLHT